MGFLAAIIAGAVGAALPIALGMGAVALIPVAMATFGTVVAGVGTCHASLAAGGIAAVLLTGTAAVAGCMAGATLGAIAT